MFIIKENDNAIEQIIDYLADNEDSYNFLAIRGDNIPVKIGQTLKPSIDMNDSSDTYGKRLQGTSAYSIANLWMKNNVKKDIDVYLKTYDYKYLSVVTGTSYTYGDDNHEIVIKNCKVLWTWKL